MVYLIVSRIIGAITALASINTGLRLAFDIDVLRALPRHPAKLVSIVVGIAGIASLLIGFKLCP